MAIFFHAVENVLRPHVRDLCHFNLLAQLVVSFLDSLDLLIEDLELYLFLFDVVLRIIDAEIVGVFAAFDLCYLVELLGNGISHIQFSV